MDYRTIGLLLQKRRSFFAIIPWWSRVATFKVSLHLISSNAFHVKQIVTERTAAGSR